MMAKRVTAAAPTGWKVNSYCAAPYKGSGSDKGFQKMYDSDANKFIKLYLLSFYQGPYHLVVLQEY